MKFSATMKSGAIVEIETVNPPTVEFEEIRVRTQDFKATSWIVGPHRWLPLVVSKGAYDLLNELDGKCFEMSSPEGWMVHEVYVMVEEAGDPGSLQLTYRYANLGTEIEIEDEPADVVSVDGDPA